MKEYDEATLKKVQQTEMEILRDFIKVCDENNLTWFGDAGSGIGYVIDSAFGPDQIEFFLLKWQSVHGTDDTLYSVFTMGFYCIFVE